MIRKIIMMLLCSIMTVPLVFAQQKTDSIKKASMAHYFEKRISKAEGIAAVVGEHIILDSDIKKAKIEIQSQGIDIKDFTDCKLLSKLMEDKLYAHHAVQDSIEVSDGEIKEYVDRQIDYFLQQMDNSMPKLLEFYKKSSERELRKELMELQKTLQLAQKMQSKITEEVTMTPEEVSQFYKKVIKKEPPLFGTEIEISQIVIKPEVTEQQIEEIKEKLLKFKEDVEINGASFGSKALLYSQDPGSRARGGLYTINRKTPFAKEFKDIAFSLEEGQISEPFKTDFGWHILMVDKIRGGVLDVRHILLIPQPTFDNINKAKEKANLIRKRIMDKEISFEEAVTEFSQEKETKNNEGKLINPSTLNSRFELTNLDPTLYNQVNDLGEGELSAPILDEDRSGNKSYKIMKINKKILEHKANYSQDYNKIQNLALKDKKIKTVQKWIKEQIQDTYINIGDSYKNCEFSNNWLKTE